MSHMHLLLHLLHSRSFLGKFSLNQHEGQDLVCLVQRLFSCAGDRGETGVPAPRSPAHPLAALVTFPDQTKSDLLTITFNVGHRFS